MMSVSLLYFSMTLLVSSDTSVVQAFFDVAPIMREFADARDSAEDEKTAAKVSRFSFIPNAKAMFVTTGMGPS
jgi:hypothetical protein